MMRKANEAVAEILIEEAALEDRKQFVENLGWLLSQTRDEVIECKLEVVSRGDECAEYVVITYINGRQRKVNVSMDSYAAIIRDVAAHFQ